MGKFRLEVEGNKYSGALRSRQFSYLTLTLHAVRGQGEASSGAALLLFLNGPEETKHHGSQRVPLYAASDCP